MQAHAVDDCIVLLVNAIQALIDHSLSDIHDLVAPIAGISSTMRLRKMLALLAAPSKHQRTRSGEESGEEQIPSDGEHNRVTDAMLVHDVAAYCGASESDKEHYPSDDEPDDGITDAMLAQTS